MGLPYPAIHLKKNKTDAILRRHHWVFSGAIHREEKGIRDGALVQVLDADNGVLGVGHYQERGSIRVRMLTFELMPVDQAFWIQSIGEAFDLRQNLGLSSSEATNTYRLVHGEGDCLPGLIIDIYHNAAVIQTHSSGMAQSRELIAKALESIYGEQLTTIYWKDNSTSVAAEDRPFLKGEEESGIVLENGLPFFVDWHTGQKTGFFLDQRENRKLLGQYAQGKSVLNAFCYSGGFSIYALQGGASQVDSVDVSAKAIRWTDQNVALNSFTEKHNSHVADVMKFLKTAAVYDIVVLDPPAFAKRLSARHKAIKGYIRLNSMGLQKVKKGGLLFTFSCSQVVSRKLFTDAVVAAALESKRRIRILHELSQPIDHPINLYHPEGAYLKGLVLYVE